MKELSELNLAENCVDVIEFKHNGEEFKKSTKLREFFNSVFSANLVAVYSTNKDPSTKNGLDWSGDAIITVSNKGCIGYLTNSEWAAVSKL